ncbi:YHYH domain-containing protein [Paenibacillus sp. GCM10027627]|uniref:YHYH domain-containing protein n=1 Tax=unclassified Paenibacillus TaxID=185978 RepID=UPI00363A1DC7
MTKKTTLIFSMLFLLFSGLASAHPGRTDSSGGHYCRTNCAKWGLADGEYHTHNGGSTSSSSSSSSSKPVDTRSPEEKKADGYIKQADSYLKAGNYYNALYYYFKASEEGYGWKVNSGQESKAAKKVADQAKTYYQTDQLVKAKQFYDLLGQNSNYSSLYDVSGNLKLITERQAFLNAFGTAQWYYNQKNYVNSVLLADKAMKDGLSKNTHAVQFMNNAALKLSQQAYSAFTKGDYETSLKLYTALANAQYAPDKLKEGAKKNLIVVQMKIDEKK